MVQSDSISLLKPPALVSSLAPIALIYPHWLTGRKTPVYLLTYSLVLSRLDCYNALLVFSLTKKKKKEEKKKRRKKKENKEEKEKKKKRRKKKKKKKEKKKKKKIK